MEDNYRIVRSIMKKLDKFNMDIQSAPRDHKEYEMLLQSYAEDIYKMCRKFYESKPCRR